MSPDSLKDFLNFQRARYSGKIICPARPHFESEACTEYFEKQLREATTYLEYGSGGSTILAAELGKRVYSVDSDRVFITRVREALGRHVPDRASNVSLLYANIGFTREWGQPVFRTPTTARLARWRLYSERPWASLKQAGHVPDLVLIDGRFRVRCALQSLQQLMNRPNARLIVDDYVGRDWYLEIGRFGEMVDVVGRMAVFRPKVVDPGEIENSIQHYAADWR
jgi:hypothetical protein